MAKQANYSYLKSLTDSQIAQEWGKLYKVANRRLRRLRETTTQKPKFYSAAYNKVREKLTSLNQRTFFKSPYDKKGNLKHAEISAIREFLQSQTSTLTGVKLWQNNTKQALIQSISGNDKELKEVLNQLDNKDLDEIMNTYNSIMQTTVLDSGTEFTLLENTARYALSQILDKDGRAQINNKNIKKFKKLIKNNSKELLHNLATTNNGINTAFKEATGQSISLKQIEQKKQQFKDYRNMR